MDSHQRYVALKSILWDSDIPISEIEELLAGKLTHAGHWTLEKLFVRMLNGLPWFMVIEIIPVNKVKEMLTDNVIQSLWPDSARKKYQYVRKRLQEALPDPG